MPLQADDYADLITTTLDELGRLKFTDLASDYQNTIALKRLIKKNKTTFDGGPHVQFRAMVATNGSARAVGLGYTAVVNIPNVMTFGIVPWRHVTWNWAMERRVIAMNAGAAYKITDILKVERISAFGDAIQLFEKFFWRVPAATDDVTPYGLPYYIVKSNTAATYANANGFNGLTPSGYTTVAGISPTTYARWANYATQYTVVSKDDLIRKMRRAAYYIDWMPLVDDMPQYETGNDFGWYTNYAVLQPMEEILESQNENLGNDIASMDGRVIFKRTPVSPVIELDKDTTNPIYGVNWGEMHTMGLTSEWMRETSVPVNPNQPTIQAVHTDCTYNLLCRNRRKQAVLSTGTSMSY